MTQAWVLRMPVIPTVVMCFLIPLPDPLRASGDGPDIARRHGAGVAQRRDQGYPASPVSFSRRAFSPSQVAGGTAETPPTQDAGQRNGE